MGIDIGDDIMYVLAVNKCEGRPVLWIWIDQAEPASQPQPFDIKNLFTEIDRTALRVYDQMRDFVSYRFTPSDFWRKTFDVRKKIWEA